MTTRIPSISGRIITVLACDDPPRDAACLCCKGLGAHWNRPGNDPDRESYPCGTCNGNGCFAIEEAGKTPEIVVHNVAIKKVSYGFPGDDEDETKAAVTLEITVANIEMAEKLRSLAGTGPYGLGIWDEALPF